jgi:hypothetical protein
MDEMTEILMLGKLGVRSYVPKRWQLSSPMRDRFALIELGEVTLGLVARLPPMSITTVVC